ncbi:DUF3843 family protein [Bacteroides sp. 224]|uniref:DUF3843 family protein n=1 Tax=Bacteroides sp. 224 TaxID=2302936 RepID=UPI0013D57324|nr:DUF3843 family protein [Bacteroides sp. 224]NDV66842.1 DUF3843 family protein [Bacteroides sp. 224]
MKKTKIYPIEWLKYHPYKVIGSVDTYYTKVANVIYDTLLIHPQLDTNYNLSSDNLIRLSCCLAAWFEDVISQTGIWRSFTAECNKRDGKFLPFNVNGNNYFDDEINVEDVRFIIWYHLQQINAENLVNPEDDLIVAAAAEIYNYLDGEYEHAPENEKMQQLFSNETKYDTFEEYKTLLDWFHYSCYLNTFNQEVLAEKLDDDIFGFDIDDEPDESEGLRVEQSFLNKNNLLAIDSPVWLSLIFKEDHPNYEAFVKVKNRGYSYYLVIDEDNEFVYVIDQGSKEKLRIAKSSFTYLPQLAPGFTVIDTFLAFYNNEWNLLGSYDFSILGDYSEDDLLTEDIIQRETAECIRKYELFLKITNGKRIVYFETRADVMKFLEENLEEEDRWGIYLSEDAIGPFYMAADPEIGFAVFNKGIACIKDVDNPFYDQEVADREAINFFVKPGFIPARITCYLQDQGMLPDACYNSEGLTEERGRIIVQENWKFLLTYFLKANL